MLPLLLEHRGERVNARRETGVVHRRTILQVGESFALMIIPCRGRQGSHIRGLYVRRFVPAPGFAVQLPQGEQCVRSARMLHAHGFEPEPKLVEAIFRAAKEHNRVLSDEELLQICKYEQAVSKHPLPLDTLEDWKAIEER